MEVSLKKVLMIAHQFPPVGGSGVQRTIKFVKYLRSFGYEPVVLTRDPRGLTLVDNSMVNEIPEGINVIRTSPWNLTELPKPFNLVGKVLNRKVLMPDGEYLWQYFGRKTAAKVVEDKDISIIYTTSYPYSDHLMGLYLKKMYPNIPWVADFRDEWTKNPNINDYGYGKARINKEIKMEAEVLEKADAVISNTPFMMENFLIGREHLRNKFTVIPNGYDEADFEGLKEIKPKNHKFTITYTGLLYGRRKPDNFFAALGKLLSEGKISASDIDVKLIGSFKPGYIKGLAQKYGADSIINELPYMKHKDSIKALMESDALMLTAGAGEEAFYLGKIFEYMYTGRPIIAIVPINGAAAQLINTTGTGLVSDSEDVLGTADNIMKIYNCYKSGTYACRPKNEMIVKYERKELTKSLSKVFDSFGVSN